MRASMRATTRSTSRASTSRIPHRLLSRRAAHGDPSSSTLRRGPLQELDLPASVELPSPDDDKARPNAVCGILSLKYPQAQSVAFHTWLAGIEAEAASFPGWLDHDVVESKPSSDELVSVSVVIRYATREQLRQWEMSDERSWWVAKAKQEKLVSYYSKMSCQSDDLVVAWHDADLHASRPPARSAPPPKWRLSVIIWLCVTSCVETWTGAQATPALLATGTVGPELALLLCIVVVVSVIVFAYSELLTELPLGSPRLSLSVWLKQPTLTVAVGTGDGCTGCLRTVAAATLECCTHGCSLFNPPPPPALPASVMRRLARTEGRLEALKVRRRQSQPPRAEPSQRQAPRTVPPSIEGHAHTPDAHAC